MLQLEIVQNGTFEMSIEKSVIENCSTCSHIKSKSRNILGKRDVLIDLDHPAKNKSDLVKSLASLDIEPKYINVVILTHFHPDHIVSSCAFYISQR